VRGRLRSLRSILIRATSQAKSNEPRNDIHWARSGHMHAFTYTFDHLDREGSDPPSRAPSCIRMKS